MICKNLTIIVQQKLIFLNVVCEGRSAQTKMTLTEESCKDVSVARKPLARLRCLKESLDCLRNNKPLPRALCYVPAEIEQVPIKNAKVAIYSLPSKSSKKLAEVMCTTEHRVFVSGEELFNASGQWAKLIKVVSIIFLQNLAY